MNNEPNTDQKLNENIEKIKENLASPRLKEQIQGKNEENTNIRSIFQMKFSFVLVYKILKVVFC